MRVAATLMILPSLLLSAGCRAGEGKSDDELGDETSIDGGTDQSESESDSAESGPKLDLPGDMDLPEQETMGCNKIDFLFVIDSSGSMANNQANLIASFPGFVTAMMESVPVDDWHVMVIDTDAQWSGSDCATACMSLGSCPGVGEFPCDTPPPGVCDISLGAGVVAPWGEAASNQDCGLVGGQRYIQKGEPDLLDAFSCVARVGVDGSDLERPMDAMVAALGAGQTEPGGCNEGFVRDDAILVVTVITDEADAHSSGDPAQWAAALVDAKLGNPDAVVVLGILPDADLAQPLCGAEAVPAGSMSEFLQLFEASSRASVCEPDYSPFFVDAVSVISETCDEFVPIG